MPSVSFTLDKLKVSGCSINGIAAILSSCSAVRSSDKVTRDLITISMPTLSP